MLKRWRFNFRTSHTLGKYISAFLSDKKWPRFEKKQSSFLRVYVHFGTICLQYVLFFLLNSFDAFWSVKWRKSVAYRCYHPYWDPITGMSVPSFPP